MMTIMMMTQVVGISGHVYQFFLSKAAAGNMPKHVIWPC